LCIFSVCAVLPVSLQYNCPVSLAPTVNVSELALPIVVLPVVVKSTGATHHLILTVAASIVIEPEAGEEIETF